MIQEGNVTVMVSDLERAIRFYTGALGLKLKGRWGDYAEVEAPGVTIGLHPAGTHGPAPGLQGSLSIGFRVDRLEPEMAALRQKGVVFSPQIVEDGPVRLAFFGDPDRNPLYLIERKAGAAAH